MICAAALAATRGTARLSNRRPRGIGEFRGRDLRAGQTRRRDRRHALHPRHLTSWCEELSWREEVWPQPLYVVGGFVHGRVLADPQGHAQQLLQSLQTPAPWFVAQVTDSLRDGLGGFRPTASGDVRRLNGCEVGAQFEEAIQD
jgi:hypothetical protein